MSKYTSFQQAKQQEPHWIDVVHEEMRLSGVPPVCDRVAADILWNLTAYPFAKEAEIRRQLSEVLRGAMHCWEYRLIHNAPGEEF